MGITTDFPSPKRYPTVGDAHFKLAAMEYDGVVRAESRCVIQYSVHAHLGGLGLL